MNYTMPVTTQRAQENIPESQSVKLVVKALTKGVEDNIDPKEGLSPEGTALHGWLVQMLQQCEVCTPERNFREASQEDYAFYAGQQDKKEVLAKLAADRRPALVFNEIRPKIDMLIGLAAQSRRAPTLVPVGKEDDPIAEVLNGAFSHFRYKLNIPRLEMDIFDDTVKAGRSLLHFYIDDENPFKPIFKAIKIDSWSFWLDGDSTAYDMEDARFLFIDKWVTKETAWARWPGQFPEPEGMGRPADTPMFFNEMNQKYRIVEGWYRKIEPVIWFVNPLTQQPEWASPEDFKKFSKAVVDGIDLPNGQRLQLPQAPQGVPGFKKFVYYAIFNGTKILAQGRNPYRHEKFPYILCGGYKDRVNNTWFGAIKTMKDPQISLNTLRRQLIHLLQTAPRGILMHESGAILNIEDYENRSAHPTYHMELSPNSIEKVKFSAQPNISPIYGQQDDVMTQSMKNTSGIQDSLLGIQTSSREPGVTVKMRQETGIAVLYTLFDNFREFRINAAKMLLSMIQQYVDYPMMIRIEGQEGAQMIQANTQLNPGIEGYNDITIGEFDVRVDETVENATVRSATAQMLTDLAHNNPNTIPPELILDYAGLPWTVQQQLREYRQQQADSAKAQQEAEWAHEIRLAEIKARTDVGTTAIQTSTQERIAHVNAESQRQRAAAGQNAPGRSSGSGQGRRGKRNPGQEG